MKMKLWYCSNTGGQQLLESCKTEDTGFSEDNCLKLLKWARDMFPMLAWQRQTTSNAKWAVKQLFKIDVK